jgi:hypothetical protein
MRTHDEKSKKKFSDSVKNRSRQKSAKLEETSNITPVSDVAGKTMIELIQSALKNHGRPMRRAEVLAAIRAAGYNKTGKDLNICNYMNQIIKRHPECGVIQPERAMFALGTPDQDYRFSGVKSTTKNNRSSSVSPSKVEVDDSFATQIEMELLRRRAQKNQELVMKMTELLIIAME